MEARRVSEGNRFTSLASASGFHPWSDFPRSPSAEADDLGRSSSGGHRYRGDDLHD